MMIKNNQILGFMLLIFILPIITAFIVLRYDLYSHNTTNKGRLNDVEVSYLTLNMDNPIPDKWQIVTYLTDDDKVNRENQYILQQLYQALGREQSRISMIVYYDDSVSSWLDEDQKPSIHYHKVEQPIVDFFQSSHFFIVDPIGNWILSYDTAIKKDYILQAKDILSDLHKLLKYSKMG